MVVVARQDLEMGLRIDKPNDHFVLCERNAEDASPMAFTHLRGLEGRNLKVPLRQGQIVTEDEILPDENGPIYPLEWDERHAVEIRFANPKLFQVGMVVDSYLHKKNETRCEPIVKGIPIIHVDNERVIVKINADDALKIATGREVGTVYFLKAADSAETNLPINRVSLEALAKMVELDDSAARP